jgi:type VI secretion system protein ImpF
MARIEADQRLQPSLLDRLIDDDPGRADPPAKSRGQSLRDLRESVRSNLENLLNTRHRCLPLPPGLGELKLSTINYGVPDFTGADLAGPAFREEFRAAIEQAIRAFEPRFMRVSVTMREADEGDRTLRFRIDALMYADPAPEPVVFDSVLDTASRAVAVTSNS